jgi:hypothetical protein
MTHQHTQHAHSRAAFLIVVAVSSMFLSESKGLVHTTGMTVAALSSLHKVRVDP